LAGALLVLVAAVHLNLYSRDGYRAIPVIGWLFVLTVVTAVLLAVLVVLRPSVIVQSGAALFCLSVLGGYVLSLVLPSGMFGFKETAISASGWIAIVAESAVAVLLVPTVVVQRRARGTRPLRR
jgi:hypothetical protein